MLNHSGRNTEWFSISLVYGRTMTIENNIKFMGQNTIHKFGYLIDSKSVESDSYPYFLLTIDEENKMRPLMVFPLELSAKKDGVYPIINCSCGEWGCGGVYVEVRNTPNTVIWETLYNNYDPSNQGNKSHSIEGKILTPVEFNRASYENAISALLIDKENFETEKGTYESNKEWFEKDPLSMFGW